MKTAKTEIETVLICDCETVLITKEVAATCPVCKQEMENAGWFESAGKEETKDVQD